MNTPSCIANQYIRGTRFMIYPSAQLLHLFPTCNVGAMKKVTVRDNRTFSEGRCLSAFPTKAPWWSKASAIALPVPELPPVTEAIRSCSNAWIALGWIWGGFEGDYQGYHKLTITCMLCTIHHCRMEYPLVSAAGKRVNAILYLCVLPDSLVFFVTGERKPHRRSTHTY